MKAINYDIDYTPQPKQALFHKSQGNEILYGGAAGPGKSHAIRFEALIWCLRVPGLQAYLFRRTFPELEKNHILPSLIQFPKKYCTYKKGDKRWEFVNGAMLHLCHCQYDQDVFLYQGAEIHALFLDELTTFTEFIYDYLRGRVRCTLDIPKNYKHKIPGIYAASNPGGVGHHFVKSRWVDFAAPMEYRRAEKREGGMLRQYIPGLLKDNKILMESDPDYIHRLDALPEPYRTAYKDGDWEIFMGQAFLFTRTEHVVPEMPIPKNARIYFSYDWGWGAPFSIGWWWIDADGRFYRFAEWYGAMGERMGLRMADTDVAEQICHFEHQLCAKYGLQEHKQLVAPNPNRPTEMFESTTIAGIVRLAGHDCFQKKPNYYTGGGQGPSTAEVFSRYKINLAVGDSERLLKIRQFRERLRIPKDGSRPMLQVYECCKDFIRTIPNLVMDEKKIEDVDTDGEDHCYDEAALLCMFRPIAIGGQKPKQKSETDRRIEAIHSRKKDNSLVHIATIESERTLQQLQRGDDDLDWLYDEPKTLPADSGRLKPTILH